MLLTTGQSLCSLFEFGEKLPDDPEVRKSSYPEIRYAMFNLLENPSSSIGAKVSGDEVRNVLLLLLSAVTAVISQFNRDSNMRLTDLQK